MCAFLGEGAEDGFFFAGSGVRGERVGVLDEQVAEVEGVGLRFTVVGRGCCCHVIVVGFVWTVRERDVKVSVWFLRTKVSKLLMAYHRYGRALLVRAGRKGGSLRQQGKDESDGLSV